MMRFTSLKPKIKKTKKKQKNTFSFEKPVNINDTLGMQPLLILIFAIFYEISLPGLSRTDKYCPILNDSNLR